MKGGNSEDDLMNNEYCDNNTDRKFTPKPIIISNIDYGNRIMLTRKYKMTRDDNGNNVLMS